MKDDTWGERDARGEWQPEVLPEPSPLFQWPPRPVAVLKYLFAPQGFLWPVNLFVVAVSVAAWFWFTPSLEQTSTFAVGWIARVFLRNTIILVIVSGSLHLTLYTWRSQGLKYKYTDKWLATNDRKFLFKNQTYDNVFWNLTSGVLTWTAWEAVTLWMYGNEIIPMISFAAHPVYFVLLLVLVVFLRMIHFYWIHRFIHWRPMFRACHYVHHKNISIGPWSGLSMHPLEHLLYFSGVALHWVIPSHPIHAIFHLMHAGITPAIGHVGFHKLVGKREKGLKTEYYFHYLHHRYFTVNFGDEVVPLDKWFGSHHDGTPEAHAEMLEKRRRHRAQPPATEADS